MQVKNGPLDFQPREPYSPLFGAMPNTPLSLELQITKEYLGQDTHLAYLGTLFEEVLKTDTQVGGPGTTVARIIDGTVDGHADSAIAGVANIGSDTNWTGSHFNQANWYAFGRMAWDPDLSARDVADEWVRQTFSNDPRVVTPATSMMMESRQALVNYMTPLGLAHIMGTDHHYGPAPWVNNLSQANWNPFYYHEADATEIGFDRTASGSNAVSQYAAPVRDALASRATVPDDAAAVLPPSGLGRDAELERDDRYGTSSFTVTARASTPSAPCGESGRKWRGSSIRNASRRSPSSCRSSTMKRAGGGTLACNTSPASPGARSRAAMPLRPTTSPTIATWPVVARPT